MAIVCPQRDALEALLTHVRQWPKGSSVGDKFELPDGTRLHLLGVSNGCSCRRESELHIAVFGHHPPSQPPQNVELLPICCFGALLTNTGKENWLEVEGLEFAGVRQQGACLRLTGRRERYRNLI